jgi:DNA-binding GntR family transcriptional regulator
VSAPRRRIWLRCALYLGIACNGGCPARPTSWEAIVAKSVSRTVKKEGAPGPAAGDSRTAPDSGIRVYLDAVPAHGSATDAVTDALREAILDGALTPSKWLREDELARQLSVSRTPVREALRRLTDEGLTVRDPHRGTMVAQMSLDDILAVYHVRETLEGLAARTAALRRPPGLVDALQDMHQQIVDRVAAGDIGAVARLNLEFHRLLRDATDNRYLERFLMQVEHAVRRFGRSTYELPSRAQEAIDEHGAIVAAVAAGDAETAERTAILHMQRAREARIQIALNG